MNTSPSEGDLGAAAAALEGLSDDAIISAWEAVVGAFLDPASPEREWLDDRLLPAHGSPSSALQAGIESVLGGLRGRHCREVFERSQGRRNSQPLLVVLAGNIPALVAQPLLPALALRRPTIVKPASRTPHFTVGFVRALGQRAPALGAGVLVRQWRGGVEASVEAEWLGMVSQVVAYGGAEAVHALRERASCPVLDYGPKFSCAVASGATDPRANAAGLARDIALFEQEGCLSVQALFVESSRAELLQSWGGAISAELTRLADRWPPPSPSAGLAAKVQHLRAEARSRGCWVSSESLRRGTVVIETDPPGSLSLVRPSPGLRTLRIYPVQDLGEVPVRLQRYRGFLQGIALAGNLPAEVIQALRELGASRFAPMGELQSPDASWQNGGKDLLEELAGE